MPLILRGGYGTFYSRTTDKPFIKRVWCPVLLVSVECRHSKRQRDISSSLFPTISYPGFFPPVARLFTYYYDNHLCRRARLSSCLDSTVFTEIFRRDTCKLAFRSGYVGTRGTHLMRQRSLNQALNASASNPIRGETSNTIANIGERVPIPGVLLTRC